MGDLGRHRTPIGRMPIYIIRHARGRKRAGRYEDMLLGDLEAADDAEARRLTEERWPGLRLLVSELRVQTPQTPRFDAPGTW